MRLITALLVVPALALAQSDIVAIECPLPENPATVDEASCALYTACMWSAADAVCHMRPNGEAGYQASGDAVPSALGFTVPIKKIDDTATMFSGDINNLLLAVNYYEDYHVNIRIVDPNNKRYEVPLPVTLPEESGTAPMMDVSYLGGDGTSIVLNVTRNSNGNELFRQIGPITYEDQFIQFSVRLSSKDLYGFGENSHPTLARSFSPRSTYPMFARDQPIDGTQNNNHYGTMPYYVNIEDADGNTYSVYIMNSNAMEYSTFELPSGEPALTFRTIGGILDVHIFAGPTPEDVNKQFASMVGFPSFPAYWTLGFQLSRWGYNSTANVRAVRNRMRAAGIPQDVQTFDIDYMDQRKDFTYDPVNFADLPELLAELKAEGIRTVGILDPAVIVDAASYEPYIRGRANDAFIKWMSPDLVPADQPVDADDYMVGYVWPVEKTVFPDFMKPSAEAWWANEIGLFLDQVPFDGIWIDMNEPANFGTNLNRPWNYPSSESDWSLQCPDNKWDSPPYSTKATNQDSNESKRLSDKTLCMSALQTDGTLNYTHYDVHSLYGYYETIATFRAMELHAPLVRPVILSRSTYPGSGRHAIHWLGDNSANWDDLRNSIIGMIEYNMFAIPMVGADVCGFFGEPSMELCARWMQLGAFYPFSRNHNTDGTADQDPAMWPEVAAISRDVLLLRYKYIPYLYALFHRSHMGGSTIVRPLFNVFPSDLNARNIADQFFWGDAIMVAPVLEEGATTRNVYFPEGKWYGLESEVLYVTGPVTLTVDAPLEKIPVYVRGGSAIPFQEPGLTTSLSRQNDFGLLIALDAQGQATGEVFWDDGVEQHTMSQTYLSKLNATNDILTMMVMHDPNAAGGINLAVIKCLGFSAQPAAITVNGADLSTYTFDAFTETLVMTLNMPLMNPLDIVYGY